MTYEEWLAKNPQAWGNVNNNSNNRNLAKTTLDTPQVFMDNEGNQWGNQQLSDKANVNIADNVALDNSPNGLAQNSNGIKWGGSDGALAGIASGVQAAAGVANAYLGYQNYNLAKDQYNYSKNLGNRNLINQSKSYNTNLQNSADVGMSLAGNSMSASDRDAYNNKIASQKLQETGV